MSKKSLQIELFNPHPGQRALIDLIKQPQIQYCVVPCGRRWGKTETALNFIVEWALTHPNSKILYCTWKGDQRETVIKDFTDLFGSSPFVRSINLQHSKVIFNVTNTELYFRISNNGAAAGLRGKKFHLIILDEFAFYNKDVFEEIIQPTLATQKNFKCIFLSTTRGRGTFYKLYQYGLDPMRPNWASYTAESYQNPYIDKEWLDDVRTQISEKQFAQEYLGHFIDDTGSIFENIDLLKRNTLYIPQRTPYWAGIDLGFKKDWCVLNIVDENNNVVYWERFNDIPIFEAARRFTETLRKWNWPTTFIETNQYQGVFEKMMEIGCYNIYEFNTNTKSKKEIITNLMALFQDKLLSVPNDEYYISELSNFGYIFDTVTRNISFAAIDGHDDIVMSLAIAFWAKHIKGSRANISFI